MSLRRIWMILAQSDTSTTEMMMAVTIFTWGLYVLDPRTTPLQEYDLAGAENLLGLFALALGIIILISLIRDYPSIRFAGFILMLPLWMLLFFLSVRIFAVMFPFYALYLVVSGWLALRIWVNKNG